MKNKLITLLLIILLLGLGSMNSVTASLDATATPTIDPTQEPTISLLQYGNYGGTCYLLFGIFDPLNQEVMEVAPTVTTTPEAEEDEILGYAVQLLDLDIEVCEVIDELAELAPYNDSTFDQDEFSFFVYCDLPYYLNAREWTGDLLFDGERLFELAFGIYKVEATSMPSDSSSRNGSESANACKPWPACKCPEGWYWSGFLGACRKDGDT